MAQVTDGCVELVIYFQCPQIQKVKVLFKFRIFSFHGWDWNLSYFNHSKGFKLMTFFSESVFMHTCTKAVLVLVHVLLYLYVLLYPVNQSCTTKNKLFRIVRSFTTKTTQFFSTVKVQIEKIDLADLVRKIGDFLS